MQIWHYPLVILSTMSIILVRQLLIYKYIKISTQNYIREINAMLHENTLDKGLVLFSDL